MISGLPGLGNVDRDHHFRTFANKMANAELRDILTPAPNSGRTYENYVEQNVLVEGANGKVRLSGT